MRKKLRKRQRRQGIQKVGVRTSNVVGRRIGHKEEDEGSDNNIDTEPLMVLNGMKKKIAKRLIKEGYGSLAAIASTPVSELENVKGIGNKTAVMFIEQANSIVNPETPPEPEEPKEPEPEEEPKEEPPQSADTSESQKKTGLLEQLGIEKE